MWILVPVTAAAAVGHSAVPAVAVDADVHADADVGAGGCEGSGACARANHDEAAAAATAA